MKNLSRLAAVASLLALAACADTISDTSTGPGSRPAVPLPANITEPSYCTAKSASDIEAEISALYFKNDWPDPNSALGKFGAIQTALAGGNLLDAQLKTRDLVKFITLKFNQLTPEKQAAAQSDFDTLVADLYCFVGISGTVYDLNPGDPAKAFVTPNGTGGVWFPPNVVPVGTMVAITDITALYACPDGIFCGTSPLDTPLDKYPTYIAIQVIPSLTFTAPNLPVVAVCFPSDTPLDVAEDLLLGHQLSTGFELLAPVTIPSELSSLLQCPTITAQGSASRSTLARWLSPIANAFLPQPLYARSLFAFGGASGSPEEFSPFGAVDTELSGFSGASSSPEEFNRTSLRTTTSPTMASVIVQDATPAVEGTVGTTQTSGLPGVYVKTRGEETPVAGVKVIFSLKPATTVTPAGNAHLCAVAGVVPTTVEVLTDATGLATLPCLDFGTTAGYSNLKAKFDPSSLTFPGADLVLVTAAGSSSDNSVNFLVKADAGAAYAIAIVEGDNKTANAYTAVSAPQPKVKVTDLYGNAVTGAGISWSPSFFQLSPPSVDPSFNLTQSDGTAAVTSWILGPGANTLLAEVSTAAGIKSVLFHGTGTITLDLANACGTGGAKDDILKYGFYAKQENKAVGAIGLNLSSNGAPGSSEDYEITLKVSLNGGSSFPYSAKARLQSSSNSSKGIESLVLFDFKNSPVPSGNGTMTVRMEALSVTGGTPQPLPANRVINMNVGTCSAGSKNCKGTTVQSGVGCNITESQLLPFVQDYRKGLAARIYVIR